MFPELFQTSWIISTYHFSSINTGRGLDSCPTWGKIRQNYPFPSKSSGLQQLALIWALNPLLALENLDLEGWLWFPLAVTHSSSKVSAAMSGSDHKRAVKLHHCTGVGCQKTRVSKKKKILNSHNEDSERLQGSKLVQVTSLPRPKTWKQQIRDIDKLPKSLPSLLFLVLRFTWRKSSSSLNANILWRSLLLLLSVLKLKEEILSPFV